MLLNINTAVIYRSDICLLSTTVGLLAIVGELGSTSMRRLEANELLSIIDNQCFCLSFSEPSTSPRHIRDLLISFREILNVVHLCLYL